MKTLHKQLRTNTITGGLHQIHKDNRRAKQRARKTNTDTNAGMFTHRKGVAGKATARPDLPVSRIIEEMMTEWQARTMPVNILTLVVMEGFFCLPKAGRIIRGIRRVHFSLAIVFTDY